MDGILEGFQKAFIGIVAAIAGTGIMSVDKVALPPPTNPPLPETVNQQEVITKSGQYTISGQTVTYTVNFPKNGGEVTGSLGGLCSGEIKGDFDGQEGGVFTGSVNPSCGVAFLRFSTNVTFTGNLFLNQGRANLDWQGNIPSTPGSGNVTVNFEPVAP